MEIPRQSPFQTLVVDLDGTLIRGDLLREGVCRYLLRKPWSLPAVLTHAIRGPLFLKQYLAERVEIGVEDLAYRQEVLELIEKSKSGGARVVLASASHESWVRRVARHLGCFDSVLGSLEVNLKGEAKLEAIRRLNPGVFAYIGNSDDDLPIWMASGFAYAVNPDAGIRKDLEASKPGAWAEVGRKSNLVRVWMKTLRVHQWAKNVLILVPVIAAHQVFGTSEMRGAALCFIAFSAVASSVYLMNDLVDLRSDRRHPSKQSRPVASGEIPLDLAFLASGGLAVSGLALSSRVSPALTGVLAIYFLLNVVYSLFLKSVPMLDVVILSGMYTLRIIAGGRSTTTEVSQWLLVFSTFFFMGLALVKRYVEALLLDAGPGDVNRFGRGYRLEDAPILLGFGMGSSLVSVLVFALYLDSPAVMSLYGRPDRLWSLVPLMMFWVGRLWLLAGRKKIPDDPVVFALRDPVSWGVGFVGLILLKWSVNA